MALDLTVFSKLDWGKHNGVVFADTQTYSNDSELKLLRDIFTLPTSVQDGKHYSIILVFEGDVEIGYVKTETNPDGTTTQKLVGKMYIPAKSPVVFSTQYILSAFFSDTYLGFRNISSVDPAVKSDFEINLLITSPDPAI